MTRFFKNFWWVFLTVPAFIWALFAMVEPPPPKQVTMTSGAAAGGYAAVAKVYQAALAEKGVTLDVLNSSGSMENIARLKGEGDVAADIAIAQTGLALDENESPLISLGAVYHEPFWVFSRPHIGISDLRDVVGKTVAIGPDGSGARALSDLLLESNGITANDFTIVSLGGKAGADALLAGEVDVFLTVAGARTGWILDLVRNSEISLLSMDRALAYTRLNPFLSKVILPKGGLSLTEDLPGSDISLIAPAAQILVKDDLHPAIQSLLLDAMTAHHAEGSLFAAPGTFPRPVASDFPMSKEASRYYENGPSVLRRFFPFDVANLLERAWVIVIPLATLAFPIFKVAPPIYRWRVRRKIYIWYRDLRRLEEQGRNAKTPEERAEVRKHLIELQKETGEVEVPESYTDNLYHLRDHIRFVFELIERIDQDGVENWV